MNPSFPSAVGLGIVALAYVVAFIKLDGKAPIGSLLVWSFRLARKTLSRGN
jgi:hypothetical protein